MARAAADGTFSSKEKEELGLLRPVVVLDGNDSPDEGDEKQLKGGEERQVATQATEWAGKAEHTAPTSDRSVDESARSNDDGTPPPSQDEGGCAIEEKDGKNPVVNEHSTDGGGAASDTPPPMKSIEGGGAPDSGPEGGARRKHGSSNSSSSSNSNSSPTAISPDTPTDEGDK